MSTAKVHLISSKDDTIIAIDNAKQVVGSSVLTSDGKVYRTDGSTVYHGTSIHPDPKNIIKICHQDILNLLFLDVDGTVCDYHRKYPAAQPFVDMVQVRGMDCHIHARDASGNVYRLSRNKDQWRHLAHLPPIAAFFFVDGPHPRTDSCNLLYSTTDGYLRDDNGNKILDVETIIREIVLLENGHGLLITSDHSCYYVRYHRYPMSGQLAINSLTLDRAMHGIRNIQKPSPVLLKRMYLTDDELYLSFIDSNDRLCVYHAGDHVVITTDITGVVDYSTTVRDKELVVIRRE